MKRKGRKEKKGKEKEKEKRMTTMAELKVETH